MILIQCLDGADPTPAYATANVILYLDFALLVDVDVGKPIHIVEVGWIEVVAVLDLLFLLFLKLLDDCVAKRFVPGEEDEGPPKKQVHYRS